MMFLRARSLSGGATASSMSRKTKSAALLAALSIISGLEPGTASSLRCSRNFFRWLMVWLMVRSSRRLGDRDTPRTAEMLDRRGHARARRQAHAANEQRHFGRGQRGAHHHLVQPAEMADAENFSEHLVQAAAERCLVGLIGALDDVAAVDAFQHQNGADRVGMPFRRLGAELQA